ncbi:DEAD/DEAH box helicase family protein [uncultured Roseibium sp.]|uniref:DEAD/DEAH box helicase family protein n=1 Tax=uncultured Roseibium sp. TaxID=1936171 RepID=UPI0032162404
MLTAEAVGRILDCRVTQTGPTMYIEAQPGSGKTTGALLWIIAQIVRNTGVRVLYGVPTVALLEQVRKSLFELLDEHSDDWANPEEHIGWWSTEHDKLRKDDNGIDRTVVIADDHYTFRPDAECRQVVIMTHNAIRKLKRDSIERINPDIVIMDEDPKPDTIKELNIEQLSRMLKACDPKQEELCSVLADAIGWMLESTGKKFELIEEASWIDRYLAIYEPASKLTGSQDHKHLAWICNRIKKGWAFSEYAGKSKTLVAYDYNLPFADRMVIVSATGSLEGAQFANPETVRFMEKQTFVPVDYSNVTVVHVSLPKFMTINRGIQKPDSVTVWSFVDVIRALEADAKERGFKTPFYCTHKDAEEKYKGVEGTREDPIGPFYRDRQQTWSYWGKDVGVNTYRHCDCAIVTGLFLLPQRVGISHKRAHQKRPMDMGFLEGHQYLTSADMKSIQDDIAARHMYQMAARTCIREVENGKAKAAVIYLVNDDVNRSRSIATRFFPDARFEQLAARVDADDISLMSSWDRSVRERYNRQKPVDKAALVLSELRAERVMLDDPVFREKGVRFNSKAVQALARDSTLLNEMGWDFVRGRRGGEKHHFAKLN